MSSVGAMMNVTTSLAGGEATDPYWSDVSLLFDGSSITGASMDMSDDARAMTVSSNVSRPSTPITGPYGTTTQNILQYSGSGSRINANTNAAALRDWDGTSTSYEMWVYLPSLTSGNRGTQTGHPYPLFSHSKDGAAIEYMTFGWHGDGSLKVYYFRNAEQNVNGTSGALTANTWHHVAYVYDTTDGKLRGYVDGVQNFSHSRNNPTNSNAEKFWIGHGSNGYMTGNITDVRITYGTARHINTGGTFTYPVPTQPLPLQGP